MAYLIWHLTVHQCQFLHVIKYSHLTDSCPCLTVWCIMLYSDYECQWEKYVWLHFMKRSLIHSHILFANLTQPSYMGSPYTFIVLDVFTTVSQSVWCGLKFGWEIDDFHLPLISMPFMSWLFNVNSQVSLVMRWGLYLTGLDIWQLAEIAGNRHHRRGVIQ